MSIITLIVGVVVIVAGLLALMIWNPFSRNLRREDFSHLVRSLLMTTENGACWRLDHRGSDVWFSYERLRGSDTAAVLALRIPRREWSESTADSLRRSYKSHGFEFVDEVDNPSLLARVHVPVDDIWDKASGAKGAHAGRLLLDTIGISQNAQFKVTEFGEVSKRILENKKFGGRE